MDRFMDRLNEKMELLDEKIQNKAAKAGEDYLAFFESHAEEAYKEYYPVSYTHLTLPTKRIV